MSETIGRNLRLKNGAVIFGKDIEAFKIYQEQWRKNRKLTDTEYRERLSDYGKNYRKMNAEKVKSQSAIWFQRNKRHKYALRKKWVENNKDKERLWQRIAQQKRRQRISNNGGGKLTPKMWLTILDYHGYKCLLCGSSNNLEIDHVIPVSLGGGNNFSNLIPLCKRCNSIKRNKFIDPRQSEKFKGQLKLY